MYKCPNCKQLKSKKSFELCPECKREAAAMEQDRHQQALAELEQKPRTWKDTWGFGRKAGK
jgi:ssDNA-binding Zn-finger/Zn-ribbon topoisomerase 1